MDSEEYFERVKGYLRRNGWNTSSSQVNDWTYLVTGTRKSETYYDRMLTLVVVEESTPLSVDHVEYLLEAAEEHDVDQVIATCRAGMTEEGSALVADRGVEFVEPSTIDDAFVDGFAESDGGPVSATTTVDTAESSQVVALEGGVLGLLLGVYVLLSGGVCAGVLALGVVGEEAAVVAASAPAAVVVVGPTLAVATGVSLARVVEDEGAAIGTLFVGNAVGHLVFAFSLGVVTAVLGETGPSTVYASPATLLGTAGLAVVVGGLSVAAWRVSGWALADDK